MTPVSTDPVPSRGPTAQLIDETLFTAGGKALAGGRCTACDAVMFPTRLGCPRCGHEQLETVALPHEGKIWTFSVLHAPAPGYHGPVPYALGVVQLGDTIRITSLLTADDLAQLRIGRRVSYELLDVGQGESTRLTFAYKLAEDGGAS